MDGMRSFSLSLLAFLTGAASQGLVHGSEGHHSPHALAINPPTAPFGGTIGEPRPIGAATDKPPVRLGTTGGSGSGG